jgi:hypothetical protein
VAPGRTSQDGRALRRSGGLGGDGRVSLPRCPGRAESQADAESGRDGRRIIVDDTLPPGLAANAAAMVALTLGATVEGLPGADLVDADGNTHPGLVAAGIPILAAAREQLPDLRARAEGSGVGVVDFPAYGQQTTNYESVIERVGRTPAADLEYLAVALHGPPRTVRRLTGSLRLLR